MKSRPYVSHQQTYNCFLVAVSCLGDDLSSKVKIRREHNSDSGQAEKETVSTNCLARKKGIPFNNFLS